jgi:predicted pyridoxine 5'-phosphate oxidase superfamily flavin-nucleotide-binding protein
MSIDLLTEKISGFLRKREFVSVATCDFNGHPNAAPKLFLKSENNFIYLIDYTIGRTWENLKINPKVSLSFMDMESLWGYQVNGVNQIIEQGKEYENVLKELNQREIDLATKRIIEGVTSGRSHKNFELAIPKRFIVFKIKIEEVVEIGPKGELNRQRV